MNEQQIKTFLDGLRPELPAVAIDLALGSMLHVQEFIEIAGKENQFLASIAFTKGGKKSVIATQFLIKERGKDKDAFADILADLRRDCDAVCFYCEAWLSKPMKKDYESGNFLPPSEDPDRTECAIAQLYVKDRTIAFQANIQRDPGRLEDWQMMIDTAIEGQTMEGRFA